MNEERKEKQLLENEALALEQVQHLLLHVVASMGVLTDEEETLSAVTKRNKHRLAMVASLCSEVSGTLAEAQRRLGNAIAIYPDLATSPRV